MIRLKSIISKLTDEHHSRIAEYGMDEYGMIDAAIMVSINGKLHHLDYAGTDVDGTIVLRVVEGNPGDVMSYYGEVYDETA